MTSLRARIAILVSMLCVAAGCAAAAPDEVESDAVVPVEVDAVQTGDIQSVVSATGVVTAAPGAELLVVAPEAARVAEVPKAEGDAVARGELLVRFEIPASTADVARQQAEIARAEAQVTNAQAARTRATTLFDRGVAARKEVEDADRDLAAAQAALAQAHASLDAASTTAARAEVRAPFAGVVAQRRHNAGDLVDASTADPVLRLVDPRRLEVVASLAPNDVPRVRAGATARLVSPAEHALTVIAPALAVDSATGAAPVRLRFAAGVPTLAIGLPVRVAIHADTRQHVLTVPVGAVVHEGEETAVFVVQGETAARRVVTLGASDGTRVEVASGLAAGDKVVTHGQAGLPDGAKITIEAARP